MYIPDVEYEECGKRFKLVRIYVSEDKVTFPIVIRQEDRDFT